jgi:hypothetical protein
MGNHSRVSRRSRSYLVHARSIAPAWEGGALCCLNRILILAKHRNPLGANEGHGFSVSRAEVGCVEEGFRMYVSTDCE